MPWNGDPSGAFLAPLALLALVFGNKRKRGKWDVFVIVLVLGLSLGLGVAACGGGTPTPAPAPDTNPAPETTPGVGSTQGAGTDTGNTSSETQPPVTAVVVPISCPVPSTDTPTPMPTLTPAPTLNWFSAVFTRYVTVREDDSFFTPNEPTWSNAVHIETTPGGKETILTPVPVWRFYVGNADTPTWSVYWNGSGMLTEPGSLSLSNGKRYVKTDINNKPPGFNAAYYFTDRLTGACGSELDANSYVIAVAYNLYGTEGHRCGDKYYINIPELGNIVFTVMDRGTFAVENGALDHFDLYVGIKDHYSFEHSDLAKYDGDEVFAARVQP